MTDSKPLEPYIKQMIVTNASDLFLIVGSPPSLRIEGKIKKLSDKIVTQEYLDGVVKSVLQEDQKYEFESNLELNVALAFDKVNRFRANFFRQMHNSGLVIRRIKVKIPTTDELKLPSIYKDTIMEKRGLILMVGGTGAGKSTSLASMLEYRNENGSGHVITVEDPIEFIHEHKNCLFTQREIGIDTYSYNVALKNALRQSPDVIVIGEIRDRETMESALIFCETGHLCVATLHANNASQAIERALNLFPEEMHQQALITLSQNLLAIFAQRLVENKRGGQSLATEVMLNAGLIKQLIEEDKIKQISEIMEKGRDQGMHTFDQSLLELINKGEISVDVALRESDNPNNLRLRVNQQKTIDPNAGTQYSVEKNVDLTGHLEEEEGNF